MPLSGFGSRFIAAARTGVLESGTEVLTVAFALVEKGQNALA